MTQLVSTRPVCGPRAHRVPSILAGLALWVCAQFFGAVESKAQVNTNPLLQDCFTGVINCDTSAIYENQGYFGYGNVNELLNNNISNPTTNVNSSNSGCLLAGELNSVWVIFRFQSDGWFKWHLAVLGNTMIGNCYDWAMWDITDSTCGDILNNTLPPVRCNWNGACNGVTGMMSGPAGVTGYNAVNFEAPLYVYDGQVLALCLSNYSGQAQGFNMNLDSTTALFSNPTRYIDTIIQRNCGDTTVDVLFKRDFFCSTLSPDGTDFRITDALGNAVPIKKAVMLDCDTQGYGKLARVTLDRPFSKNGLHYLFSKQGQDGNTLMSSCDAEQMEFDSIAIIVTGCPETEGKLSMRNVTVVNNNQIHVQWSRPPAPFDTPSFAAYNLERTDQNALNNFTVQAAIVANVDTLRAVDVAVDPTGGFYTYRVNTDYQPGALFMRDVSDSLASIYLTMAPYAQGDTGINLSWTPYWGWWMPQYRVAIYDSADMRWAYDYPTFETFASIRTPHVPGKYRLLIETYNTADSSLVSRSNYLEFGVPVPPPIDYTLVVPNVVTPNGDGKNDTWVISNIDNRPGTVVQLFNRWGQMVLNSDAYDGKFPKAGGSQDISAGTYYYRILPPNHPELRGTLTVLR